MRRNDLLKQLDYCTRLFCYRDRKIYEPPRYMTVNQAAEQLLEIVKNRRSRGDSIGKVELFKSISFVLNYYHSNSGSAVRQAFHSCPFLLSTNDN